jgi:hypothetical protein
MMDATDVSVHSVEWRRLINVQETGWGMRRPGLGQQLAREL